MKFVSLIIVHYHTPQCLRHLVESIYEISDLQELPFEVIIVDNGGGLDLEIKASQSSCRVLSSEQNLGYGGGINFGMTHAQGDMLFFMNADLKLNEGCITRLIELLDHTDVVGPRFYLDEDLQIVLPPTQKHDLTSTLLMRLGAFVDLVKRRVAKNWWLETRRHVLAPSPIFTNLLSGALIGTSREAWLKIGPFDENFFLYFEETDWLLRAKKLGLTIKYDPKAEVIHHYNQSAKVEAEAAGWYANSARYFSKKHHSLFGRILLWVLEKIVLENKRKNAELWVRKKTGLAKQFEPILLGDTLQQVHSHCFLQMSINISFVPSAILPLKKSDIKKPFTLSMEVWDKLAYGSYYFRVVDYNGTQLVP